AMSPDGSRLATGATDGTVRLWDRATQKSVSSFTAGGPVRLVLFNAAGDRLLAVGGPAVHVWSVTSSGDHTLITHAEDVTDARFSPDGKRIATASLDDTARVWDTATGHPITPPLKNGSDVFCVAWDTDGRRIVAGGDDNTARVWDAATGQLIGPPLPHAG